MLCFLQAFLYVVCGTYGPLSELGFGLAFLIGLQVNDSFTRFIHMMDSRRFSPLFLIQSVPFHSRSRPVTFAAATSVGDERSTDGCFAGLHSSPSRAAL